MNTYFLKRLLPFFIFYIILELISVVVIVSYEPAQIDLSLQEMLKSLSILLLTSSASFLYMMIPYLLYLLFLPANKQNSKTDRIITTTLCFIFVGVNLFEETSSFIFWDEFASAFNFIAVDYLIYTTEVIDNIRQSYPLLPIFATLGTATVLCTWLLQKFLFTKEPAPKFSFRLFRVALYAMLCVLIYKNVDMTNLEFSKNRTNNEIGKEGTYSLFSAFLKNELPYKDFYLTQEPEQNGAILQQKLASANAKFANDLQVTRKISSGKPERKANVVIVLMESFSAKFMHTDLTPNLSKLATQSLYFPNTYANGTRSVRGIEALTLAVPPLPGMSIVRRPNNENLHSIGSIFKDKGYTAKWIYGGYGYFDNMNYFFEHNGFEVIDRQTWKPEEITFANAWGASDEDTFNKVIKEADASYAKGLPFLSVTLTISNHRPFTYPEGKIDLAPKVSRRNGGVKYADYAVGQFLEQAKTKPWFDNTVFVFVADHTAGAAGNEEIELEDHHIPLMIYAPKFIKAQKIETAISQIDALPTLLALLNSNYESRFYGQNALDKNYESRFFVSNYQKIGYVKDGNMLILKPVKQFSFYPQSEGTKPDKYLEEAIAFYQQSSDWIKNLKAE